MSRHIDADALERIIRKRVYAVEVDDILADISSAPSIDIVRCGECNEWNEYARDELGRCDCHLITTRADDFCSYGEREGE